MSASGRYLGDDPVHSRNPGLLEVQTYVHGFACRHWVHTQEHEPSLVVKHEGEVVAGCDSENFDALVPLLC